MRQDPCTTDIATAARCVQRPPGHGGDGRHCGTERSHWSVLGGAIHHRSDGGVDGESGSENWTVNKVLIQDWKGRSRQTAGFVWGQEKKHIYIYMW